jgi:hypothetical protein
LAQHAAGKWRLSRCGFESSVVSMISLRSSLLAALLVFTSMVRADSVADRGGPQGFDFEVGEWRVHHRIKRPTGEWYEFEGTCSMRPLMAGAANVEEHVFARPTGTTYGVAVRAYDAEKKHWSIWWVDSRYMSLMGEPAIGRFENGVGNFYSDYTDPRGKTVRGRLTWSQITPTSARWEQSSSSDGGRTWEPNWIMEFKRK